MTYIEGNNSKKTAMTEGILQSLAAVAPRTGVPFREAFRVQHGPPGLLGRFFLSAEGRLLDKGITLKFITFDELIALNRQNADNWGFFNPMFDHRCSNIAPGSMCLAGFDRDGVIRATICGKPFDAVYQSFANIVNAGGFFSIRPEDNAMGLETKIVEPMPADLTGLIGYCAAVWVHPDWRGKRLAAVFCRLMNACMLTLWNPKCLMGSLRRESIGTELHARYGFSQVAPSIQITQHGTLLMDGVVIWMGADETMDELRLFLDKLWPQIDAAVAARDRYKAG